MRRVSAAATGELRSGPEKIFSLDRHVQLLVAAREYPGLEAFRLAMVGKNIPGRFRFRVRPTAAIDRA